MNAFIRFNRGVLRLPIGVRLWMLLVGSANFILPVIYFQQSEARIVLLTFLASFLLMVLITGTSGFTRLVGLGHIFWVPLVLLLVNRLDSIPATDTYGIWLRSVIVLNTISLVLDAVDAVRFARGERSEIVSVE
ncbi:MAG: hypothetical protein V3R16_05355 [Nitrospirales bacterium]